MESGSPSPFFLAHSRFCICWQQPRQVELKNVILKWHAGKENFLHQDMSMPYPPFYYKPSAGEYLCGYQSFCLSPNSKKARIKSISNIDSHYSVVGVVEDNRCHDGE